jgi:hypothetical protein
MSEITGGIWSDFPNFYTNIAHCLQHALDRQYKEQCRNIPKMWPTGAGALLFFQVEKAKQKKLICKLGSANKTDCLRRLTR